MPTSRRPFAPVALAAFAMAWALGACTTAPTTPPAVAPAASAAQLDGWRVQGRMGVVEDGRNWQASVNWAQQGQRFAIDLIGPFGQGGVRVSGDGQAVELQTGRETLRAADPDRLLARATGVALPISGLRYWIRGLPAPEDAAPARVTRDGQGRIARLEQNGWRIDYPNYVQVQGLTLPQRIEASRGPALRITIVIGNWTLPPA